MEKKKRAIVYFADAIRESNETMLNASEALQKELSEQNDYFALAMMALRKQIPMKAKPYKRIPGICKCPICKEDCIHEDCKPDMVVQEGWCKYQVRTDWENGDGEPQGGYYVEMCKKQPINMYGKKFRGWFPVWVVRKDEWY